MPELDGSKATLTAAGSAAPVFDLHRAFEVVDGERELGGEIERLQSALDALVAEGA